MGMGHSCEWLSAISDSERGCCGLLLQPQQAFFEQKVAGWITCPGIALNAMKGVMGLVFLQEMWLS
jgi:hypothetical protein